MPGPALPSGFRAADAGGADKSAGSTRAEAAAAKPRAGWAGGRRGPARVCARAPSAHPTDARQAGRERVAELHQGDQS